MKTIPFTAAHTHIAYIWQYPPGAKLNDKVSSNASFSQPLIMDTLGTDATVHKTEESKSTVPRVVEKYEYSLDGFHLGVARGTQRQFSENI